MTTSQIRDLILQALPEAIVEVHNPMQDGQHFGAIVIAPQFTGLTMIKQQRLVNEVLKPYFDSGEIHALQLKTYSPEQWQNQGGAVELL